MCSPFEADESKNFREKHTKFYFSKSILTFLENVCSYLEHACFDLEGVQFCWICIKLPWKCIFLFEECLVWPGNGPQGIFWTRMELTPKPLWNDTRGWGYHEGHRVPGSNCGNSLSLENANSKGSASFAQAYSLGIIGPIYVIVFTQRSEQNVLLRRPIIMTCTVVEILYMICATKRKAI